MDRVTDLTTGLQIGLKPVNGYDLFYLWPVMSLIKPVNVSVWWWMLAGCRLQKWSSVYIYRV